jgi:hypothetical protein
VGLKELENHVRLKQGNIVLTFLPKQKEEALAVARYCREHQIYLCLSELLWRGTDQLCFAYRQKISRNEFYSKQEIDEIIHAAGTYYFGRLSIGEIGGVVYWLNSYTQNQKVGEWESLPECRTVDEAERRYVDYCKRWIDYEKSELGGGPLLNVDSSMLFKYHAQAGVDRLCLEMLPGDPHLMLASVRGTARSYQKQWGTHIAMMWYGGLCLDELWQKRWRTSLFYCYLCGADFIYPESGHYAYSNTTHGQEYHFKSPEIKRVRSAIREAWQFANINRRPASGPKVTLGVIHGNHDGWSGLWNEWVWGQSQDSKWAAGPAEKGWEYVSQFYRKEDCFRETVAGAVDYSGQPPYGQYDIVPIEASVNVLKSYKCLVVLGWNTMTDAIYEKLKEYVKSGGHLLMFLPQLSTQVDRAADLEIIRKGDLSDLFGVRIHGKERRDMLGIQCIASSKLKTWRFPLGRLPSDPRFVGPMTPAKVELTDAKVLCRFSNYYYEEQDAYRAFPAVVEKSLGKGTAFLVTAWEYPGDHGMKRLVSELVHVMLQGEQGHIKVLGSDRIRYSVYKQDISKDRQGDLIYLLNTDPDCTGMVALTIHNRMSKEFIVQAGEMRVAYHCDGVLLVPDDKRIDLKEWKTGRRRHKLDFYSFKNTSIEIQNLSENELEIIIGNRTYTLESAEVIRVRIPRAIDPHREYFFKKDFMKEPDLHSVSESLPY